MTYRPGLLLLALALTACQPKSPDSGASGEPQAEPFVVEVVARDFTFEAPESVPSGWLTFRMRNAGMMPHFILFQKLPDTLSFEEYLETVPPAFGVAYEHRDGELSYEQAIEKLVAQLPGWFWTDVKQMGGNGFASGDVTTETTLYLEPGRYTMECYVKTPEGVFHTDLGMIRELTVTGVNSGAPEPVADLHVRLTNFEFSPDRAPRAGQQVIAVHFDEHPEGSLGNDLHVVQLESPDDLDAVVAWMDWLAVDGLRPPEPGRFLGGTQEMPVGQTAYFTVDLEPGHYAFVAETAGARGMVYPFTIQ